MRHKFVLLGLILLTVAVGQAALADQVKIFKINHRPAPEMLSLVQAALSKKGTAVLDKRTNSIIVRDSTIGIRRVAALLSKQDLPLKNISVSLSEVGKNELSKLGVSVDWNVKKGNWRAGNLRGRNDGTRIGVTGTRRTQESKATTTRRLLVASGGRGMLLSGQNIPASKSRIRRFEGYGFQIPQGRHSSVQTGFEVAPIVIDGKVHLELVPVITFFGDSGVQTTRLPHAALTVIVPDNGQVVIGSVDSSGQSVVRDIFSGFSKTTASGQSYLMLEVNVDP